jgi:hypothetical protein
MCWRGDVKSVEDPFGRLAWVSVAAWVFKDQWLKELPLARGLLESWHEPTASCAPLHAWDGVRRLRNADPVERWFLRNAASEEDHSKDSLREFSLRTGLVCTGG